MSAAVTIGVDLGSTAIKIAVVENGRLLGCKSTPTAPGQEERAQGLIDAVLEELGLTQAGRVRIAATGYGKRLFARADRQIDEITANALGIFRLSNGEARTVINIGGQDLKVLSLADDGSVMDFRMNDKCAAGTGRFFELAARLLDTPVQDFWKLALEADAEPELNSTCVVFAETEIVSLLAQGERKENIIKALHASVARRAAGLTGRAAPREAVYLDGGPAQNRGLVEALEDELMLEVRVVDKPQFTVAYGAALAAACV